MPPSIFPLPPQLLRFPSPAPPPSRVRIKSLLEKCCLSCTLDQMETKSHRAKLYSQPILNVQLVRKGIIYNGRLTFIQSNILEDNLLIAIRNILRREMERLLDRQIKGEKERKGKRERAREREKERKREKERERESEKWREREREE